MSYCGLAVHTVGCADSQCKGHPCSTCSADAAHALVVDDVRPAPRLALHVLLEVWASSPSSTAQYADVSSPAMQQWAEGQLSHHASSAAAQAQPGRARLQRALSPVIAHPVLASSLADAAMQMTDMGDCLLAGWAATR